MTFKTPDESGFLVFGVSNAKYLAFDTPDENALRCISIFEELFFAIYLIFTNNFVK